MIGRRTSLTVEVWTLWVRSPPFMINSTCSPGPHAVGSLTGRMIGSQCQREKILPCPAPPLPPCGDAGGRHGGADGGSSGGRTAANAAPLVVRGGRGLRDGG